LAGYADFYLTRADYLFAGVEGGRGRVAVFGVPFDSTASYRPGQRFGPSALRRASANIESNSIYDYEAYIEEASPRDLGDVAVVFGDPHQTLRRVALVVEELVAEGLVPAMIGGEHLATLGVLEGLARATGKTCMVSLDAHFDLREEYLGVQLSHATHARRALEKGLVERAVFVGVRAWDPEEYRYAREKPNIRFIPAPDVYSMGSKTVAGIVRRFLEPCKTVYFTLDLDVYDPGYAPGVANPEPGGLNLFQVADIIHGVFDERIVGFDVVELAPNYDCNGTASVLAAKTLQEMIIAYHKAAGRRAR